MKFSTCEDFNVKNGSGTANSSERLLTLTDASGFDLVLFYSTQCPHCLEYVNAMKQCNDMASNVTVRLMNIDNNKDIIKMSLDTTTVLERVPYIVMYAKGEPYMSYGGPPDVKEILEYCRDVSVHYINSIKKNKPEGEEKEPLGKNQCDPADKECVYKAEYNTSYMCMTDAYTDRCSS